MRKTSLPHVLLLSFWIAVWLQFLLVSTAHADDCMRYIQNPVNFLTVPRGLIEDCQRTPGAQALLTGLAASLAGSAAGATVASILTQMAQQPQTGQRFPTTIKPPREYGGRPNVWDPTVEEQQNRWIKEHLVWDPQTLSWRPPRPGEVPPPPDAPEDPPPYQRQNPRDKVPVDCLDLYDAYVKQQARAIKLEEEIKFASEAQFDAQKRLNQLLAKFTLKFGYEIADMALLARGIAELTVHLGAAMSKFLPRTMAEALEAARGLFRRASSKAAGLTDELAEVSRVAGSKAKLADEVAEGARSLRGTADDAGRVLKETDEAAKAAQTAVKEAEDALAAATSQVDKLKAQRALLEAQKSALDGQAQLYKQWNDAYLKYLGQKPAAGIGSRFYDEAFKLEMLGLDINAAKIDISRLRGLPNPSPAQLQELANLESKVANLYKQAEPLKKVMDDAAKAFYGVDDVSKITNQFMDQHLEKHLRQVMGEEAFARYRASSGTDLVNAVNKAKEIEEKLLPEIDKALDPLMQQARKAGTQVAKVSEEAKKSQTLLNKVSNDATEAASKAAQAESKAADAAQEASKAEEVVNTTRTNLNAAKEEVSAAEKALNVAEGEAREHMKAHFAEKPEEVAKILVGARDDLQRIVDNLKALMAERDKVMDDLRWLKPKLDACLAEHGG